VFYVFSANALPFEAERGYDKSEVFAVLWCDGDKSKAYHLLDEFLSKQTSTGSLQHEAGGLSK
jgi:hypothetical protein